MTSLKTPKLKIFDHEATSCYRFRYYVKSEKRYKYRMARYGKRHTKEQAYEEINRKRDELITKVFVQ